MIIQCPSCATRYVVPDTAIGVDGRTVRCAKCRQSWFQEGPELDLQDDAAGSPQTARSGEVEGDVQGNGASSRDTATAADTPARSDDVAQSGRQEQPAPAASHEEVPSAPPPIGKVHYSRSNESTFDSAPPFRRRHNPLRMWSWAAGIFAVLVAGLIVAVSYFGLPDWVPVSRPTFAAGEPDLQISFPADQQERRQLPNGTAYFGASGTITNIGTQERSLPTILIVLRDGRDRIVYSWEVPPPQRELAPGESLTINEAVTDIPRSARFAEFGWKPQ